VYLHLNSGFLRWSGESDDVADSVHYGYLTKAISALVEKRGSKGGFDGIDELVKDVAEEAFKLGGENVEAVRVIVEAPKLVLLAGNFKVDVTVPSAGKGDGAGLAAKAVMVEELTIPVIIGVNPPEREAKQRVVTDLVFYEKPGTNLSHVEYQSIVDKLAKVRFYAS
jgi:dihydroneopterin aldolase